MSFANTDRRNVTHYFLFDIGFLRHGLLDKRGLTVVDHASEVVTWPTFARKGETHGGRSPFRALRDGRNDDLWPLVFLCSFELAR